MSRFFYDLGRRTGPKLRTGKWWLSSMTGSRKQRLAAELAVGRDLAAAIEAQRALDPDPEIQRFAAEVGGHLVAQAPDGGRSFRFQVLAEGEANAFALPGGFIYVERKLLELTEWSAAELAFVLGHEMAHVLLEHALGRLVSEGVVSAALRVLPAGRALGGWVAGKGRALLESSYSREQEEQADHKGLQLSWAAGFPADAGARMLERLRQHEGSSRPLDAYFASHPPLAERVLRLRRLTDKLSARSSR